MYLRFNMIYISELNTKWKIWIRSSRGEFRKGIIERLTFMWTMQMVEVRFEQMELRERISNAKKEKKDKKERESGKKGKNNRKYQNNK